MVWGLNCSTNWYLRSCVWMEVFIPLLGALKVRVWDRARALMVLFINIFMKGKLERNLERILLCRDKAL